MTKQMFARITKRDDEKREVTGTLADETPDHDGEVFDYAGSLPYFKAWNSHFSKMTDGASVGNVREMHRNDSAVGNFVSMDYDDDAKSISVTAKVTDDQAWKKVVARTYTGFSIGGDYVGAKPAGKNARYIANPIEGSLVDYACNPNATFKLIKAAGVVETVKLAKDGGATTKRVDGADLPAHCFAYVGDPDKTDTWKLPIEFPGDEEKTKSHIRNALARFGQTEGIPDGERPSVHAKIEAAAKSHGIDTESAEKSEIAEMRKLAAELSAALAKFSGAVGPNSTKETTKMAETETGLQKARSLKDHLDKAKEAHAKMGEHLDALGNAIGADGDADDAARKVAGATSDSVTKAAETRFAALEAGQNQTMEVLAEIAKTVAAIAGQPVPPAAAANGTGTAVVTKAADNGTRTGAEVIDPKDPEAARKAITASLQKPIAPVR